MQVFISWSGERSRLIADALRVWLPRVIQSLRPWMSDVDISAGSRWLADVSKALDSTSVGLICVTPENVNSPWLNFEAGAISKTLDESRVCPLALDMTPGQVSGPLSQFQTVALNRDGVRKVLSTLNSLLQGSVISSSELDEIFDVWWPRLEQRIHELPAAPGPKTVRSSEDQLEELVQIAREQQRRDTLRIENTQRRDSRVDALLDLMDGAISSLAPATSALGSLRAGLQSAAASIVAASPDQSPEQRAQLLESLTRMASTLGDLPSVSIPTSPMLQLTKQLKILQQEDKEHLQTLLQSPEPQGKEPGA